MILNYTIATPLTCYCWTINWTLSVIYYMKLKTYYLLQKFIIILEYCRNVHPAPPSFSHFSFHQALCNLSNLQEPKYCMQLGNFLKFRPKNWKLSILPETWHTWYLGGGGSESVLRFFKVLSQNPFLGKFGL